MFTVWKYTIEVSDIVEIEMPLDAEILHIDTQRGTVCIWVRVNSDIIQTVKRKFRIAGTGHPLEMPDQEFNASDLVYYGTVKLFNDSIVLHVFEIDPALEFGMCGHR